MELCLGQPDCYVLVSQGVVLQVEPRIVAGKEDSMTGWQPSMFSGKPIDSIRKTIGKP